jgi:integrase
LVVTPIPLAISPTTYGELVERFMDQYVARSAPWKREMLSYSVRAFGVVPVRELLPDRIGAWINTQTHLAPKTRRHILESMRQVLGAGVEWGYLPQNPARSSAIRPPRQVSGKIRPFESWDEVHRVAQATGRYEALVRFGCAAGLRPEEWIPLTWADIDIDGRVVVVNKVCLDGVIHHDQGKTDAAFRRVQLQREALDALSALPTPLSRKRLVFPSPTGSLINLDNWRRRTWKPALQEAGLAYRPPYQMRHTFATLALAADADLYWVSAQLGHTDISTTLKHYARFLRPVDDRNLRVLDAFAEPVDTALARSG